MVLGGELCEVGTGSGECEVAVQLSMLQLICWRIRGCTTVSDERCVMCNSGVGEDVAHFMVCCGGFERDRLVLLDDVYRIVETREWLDEFLRVDEEGKEALLLGKEVEDICNRVMEDVGECILCWFGRWWQGRKQLLYG